MSMSINELSIGSERTTFHDPQFCRTLEGYLPFLRESDGMEEMIVTPHEAYKFEGDLYGLLSSKSIPNKYHWLVMRLNGFRSPTENDENLSYLQIPEFSFIERIRQIYKTQAKK